MTVEEEADDEEADEIDEADEDGWSSVTSVFVAARETDDDELEYIELVVDGVFGES